MPSPSIVKRQKRGRKGEPSSLSTQMRLAVERFSEKVGSPPFAARGHRDFRRWLGHIRTPQYVPFWNDLCEAMGIELFIHSGTASVRFLRKEIVREIISCVVIPRPYESPKLVSITAYRHTTGSGSCNTLLSVFEDHLRSGIACDNTADNPVSSACTGSIDATDARELIMYPKESRDTVIRSRSPSLSVELPSFRDLVSFAVIKGCSDVNESRSA